MTAPAPARARWQTGIATVVAYNGAQTLVDCPFCGDKHTHARSFVGSRHVVAGCHRGPTLLREYAIADRRGGGRR